MYGEVTQTVGSLASDFQYAGYYFHAPSGLNLCTYRAYSPTLGRWINRDPIGEGDSLNLYVDVDNDPINNTDELGLAKSGGSRGGNRGGRAPRGPQGESPFCRSIKCCEQARDTCADRCGIYWMMINIMRLKTEQAGLSPSVLNSCRFCCTQRKEDCIRAVVKKDKFPKARFNCPNQCIFDED